MKTPRTEGFTLVELMVVIALVAIVAALLFPALVAAKGRSKRTVCAANFGQLYLATDLYCSDNNGWNNPPPTIPDIMPYAKNSAVFRCPVEDDLRPNKDGLWPAQLYWAETVWTPLRISYPYLRTYPPADNPEVWGRLLETPNVGFLSCHWHGDRGGRVTSFAGEPLQAFWGPVQRVCFDGHLFTWHRQPGSSAAAWSVRDAFYAPWSGPPSLGGGM